MQTEDFKSNFTMAILKYKIINIFLGKEKIVIGEGGIKKEFIRIAPNGFCVMGLNSAKWYSFSNITKIEVYGHEL